MRVEHHIYDESQWWTLQLIDTSNPNSRGLKIANKVAMWLYASGVVSGGSYSQTHRDGAWHYVREVTLGFRPRPYVLWRLREHWFHLPRFGHGYYEVMGMCGKCCPWPCCGAIDYGHASDCKES